MLRFFHLECLYEVFGILMWWWNFTFLLNKEVVTHVKSEAIHWALTLKIILNSGCIQYIKKKKNFVPPQTKATQAWTDQIICHCYLKTYAGTCKNIHQLNIIYRCHVLTNLFQSVIENYDFCRDCIVARNRTLQEKFAMKMSQDFCGLNLQHIFFCCIFISIFWNRGNDNDNNWGLKILNHTCKQMWSNVWFLFNRKTLQPLKTDLTTPYRIICRFTWCLKFNNMWCSSLKLTQLMTCYDNVNNEINI